MAPTKMPPLRSSRPQVDAIRRKAAVIARVFGSPDGQEALKILQDQFGGSCYAKGDSHHTAYLEGGRDVLIYIRQMTNAANKGEEHGPEPT